MLHVRAEQVPSPLSADDLARLEPGALTAATLVSTRADGPWRPLAEALVVDDPLRDALATALPTPSLRGERRVRGAALALTLLPLGMLLELDRELGARPETSVARLAVDLVLVATIVAELARARPRAPRVAALALLAVAGRWGLVLARGCGTATPASPLVVAATALALGAAALLATRVPTRERIAQELLGKLGIERTAARAARTPAPADGALLAAALGAAAGLPGLLFAIRHLGGGGGLATGACLAYALVVPAAVRRAFDRSPARAGGTRAREALQAAWTGLAMAAALVALGRLFFDHGAELARCLHRLGPEARLARTAEAAELARTAARVRGDAGLVLAATTVFPFAEERIFRAVLQDVLVRRYGRTYGVFAAALAFGIAHLGVYEIALYQTVLLGIGFGIAYAEGGLVAAVLAHAAWNLVQVL